MTDDRYQWTCRECEAANDVRKLKCACGATRPKDVSAASGSTDRRLCSFVSVHGRQCPLPGDLQDRPDGKRWCGGHFKDQSGPMAEKVFDDAVTNYEAIIANVKVSNNLLAWWEAEGKAQRAKEKAKAPPVNEEAEKERRRKEAEQLADEARIEREAVQVESGAFPDESF